MRPIDVIEGKVSVLDRNDVDTDQIIPKQFLKRVERTGFGEFLFYDWIRDGEIELEPNPILVTGSQLRLRLLARARPLGAGGLRLPGDRRALLRRHLLLQLHQDRPAAGDSRRGALPAASPKPARRGSTSTTRPSPARPASSTFAVEPDVKHRLLNGLDDIGITLENGGAIDSFEGSGAAARGPVTTSL